MSCLQNSQMLKAHHLICLKRTFEEVLLSRTEQRERKSKKKRCAEEKRNILELAGKSNMETNERMSREGISTMIYRGGIKYGNGTAMSAAKEKG